MFKVIYNDNAKQTVETQIRLLIKKHSGGVVGDIPLVWIFNFCFNTPGYTIGTSIVKSMIFNFYFNRFSYHSIIPVIVV